MGFITELPIGSPGFQAFGLRQNYTPNLPGPPGCRWEIMGLLSLHNHMNVYTHTIYIYMTHYEKLVLVIGYIYTNTLFLWRNLTAVGKTMETVKSLVVARGKERGQHRDFFCRAHSTLCVSLVVDAYH